MNLHNADDVGFNREHTIRAMCRNLFPYTVDGRIFGAIEFAGVINQNDMPMWAGKNQSKFRKYGTRDFIAFSCSAGEMAIEPKESRFIDHRKNFCKADTAISFQDRDVFARTLLE